MPIAPARLPQYAPAFRARFGRVCARVVCARECALWRRVYPHPTPKAPSPPPSCALVTRNARYARACTPARRERNARPERDTRQRAHAPGSARARRARARTRARLAQRQPPALAREARPRMRPGSRAPAGLRPSPVAGGVARARSARARATRTRTPERGQRNARAHVTRAPRSAVRRKGTARESRALPPARGSKDRARRIAVYSRADARGRIARANATPFG